MKLKLFIISFLMFFITKTLHAQNMWQEYHLVPNIKSVSFTDKYVWLGLSDGVIKLDTTNWSYTYLNYNSTPALVLSADTPFITVGNVQYVMKNNGNEIFFQDDRALRFNGQQFTEEIYLPPPDQQTDYQFVDSSGTIWNFQNFNVASQYLNGNSWVTDTLNLDYTYAIDTNGCFIADWDSGIVRICSPNIFKPFTFQVSGDFTSLDIFKIDYKNNQWYWLNDSSKLYKYDGKNLTSNYLILPGAPIFFNMKTGSGNDVYFNNYNEELAYRVIGNNVISIDTSALGKGTLIDYYISPAGRLFALLLNNNVGTLYSTIDNGKNWQLYHLNDINFSNDYSGIIEFYQEDSLGNVYLAQGKTVKKLGTNWTVQQDSINSDIDQIYLLDPSSNGICWFNAAKNGGSPKIFKWNPNTNQVDSFLNFGRYGNNGIIACNDTRFWMFSGGTDTILESDGNSILNSYVEPYKLSEWDFGNNFYQTCSHVIGNSFYDLSLETNKRFHLIKLENGIVTDISAQTGKYFTSSYYFKDHANNIWTITDEALYKWNGNVMDSIVLPNNLGSPLIAFNDSDQLLLMGCINAVSYPFLNTHVYQYTSSGWVDYPLPTPFVEVNQFFYKEGYFWIENGQSLLRFDPAGAPNLLDGAFVIKDENKSVQIYPNPTNDFVYINSQNEKMKSVSIYDLSGRKCLEQYVNNNLSIRPLS